MLRVATPLALLATLSLGACAVAPPSGPSAMALPGQNKNFEAFQQDDANCRQYASASIGYGTPQEAANQSAVGSAAIGTVVGAAAGAALGAAAGNPGLGAAAGAGAGLLTGSAVGANNAQASGAGMQQRYDMSYMQCMYGKGNSVPTQASAPQAAYYYPSYPAYPAYPAYGYYYPPPVYGSVTFGGGFHHRRW